MLATDATKGCPGKFPRSLLRGNLPLTIAGILPERSSTLKLRLQRVETMWFSHGRNRAAFTCQISHLNISIWGEFWHRLRLSGCRWAKRQ